jgi:hypothetical protein
MEGQKGGRACTQIDKGAAQTGIDLRNPADRPGAQPMLGKIAVPMDQKMGVAAVTLDGAAGLARRLIEKGLDLAAHARQPAP